MVLAVGDDVFALAPEGPFRGDRLPDEWQAQFFAANPPSAVPSADPDGDGWPNELEWRFGTDPTALRSQPAPRIELGASGVLIGFPDPDPLLTLKLESTDHLGEPFKPAPAVGMRTNGEIRWVVGTLPETARFFRVAVSVP